MATRDIRAHLREMYGVEVSPDLISRVTGAVADELAGWQARPLDAVYPVIFNSALMVKIRDGVGRRPAGLPGHRHRLRRRQAGAGPVDRPGGRRAGEVLADRAQRAEVPGVADVRIVCCAGLTGLPDAVTVTWPRAVVQLCVVHLIRAPLRYASKKYQGR